MWSQMKKLFMERMKLAGTVTFSVLMLLIGVSLGGLMMYIMFGIVVPFVLTISIVFFGTMFLCWALKVPTGDVLPIIIVGFLLSEFLASNFSPQTQDWAVQHKMLSFYCIAGIVVALGIINMIARIIRGDSQGAPG